MSYLESLAGSTLLPMESLSVAMTSAPKSIPILSSIYKISTDIRETTERVETNKSQCEQLSERIDTLIGFLSQRDLSQCLNEAMRIALHRFETFLRRCLEFISTFLETTWFKRIVNNKDHEKKFSDLNRELTQYANDLNFGIGLSNMHANQKHEEDPKTETESVELPPSVVVKDASMKYEKEPSQKMVDDHREIPRRETPVIAKNVSPSVPRRILNIPPPPSTIFLSGLWKYGYKQYNQYFGPFPHQLVFNPNNRTLHGYGKDNVGHYELTGTYSDETGRMQMTQSYQFGTGNPALNLGHQDVMQLSWNSMRNRFEGVAYSNAHGSYIPGALIEMWLA